MTTEGPDSGATTPASRRPEDFDAAYTGTPPWDIGRPQPVFVRLAESGQLRGRVLDVGCGTGEHALLAASIGLDATGIDTSPKAIARAQRKADERNLPARFLVWDALDLAGLHQQFDTVIDSGLFHIFDDDARMRYVDSLSAVLAPGGWYCMLSFSEQQPGTWGPRRLAEHDIRDAFSSSTSSTSTGWHVESLERTTMDVTIESGQVQAWLAVIRRTDQLP